MAILVTPGMGAKQDNTSTRQASLHGLFNCAIYCQIFHKPKIQNKLNELKLRRTDC